MSVTAIETSKYYRNKLNDVVLIVGTLVPGTPWYSRGFRFVDHQGTYYTDTGTLKSKLFDKLDLVAEVAESTLTSAEIKKVSDVLVKRMKRMMLARKALLVTGDVVNFALPITSGLNVGLGIANLAVRPLLSMFNIAIGVGGMIQYKDLNWKEERKRFI